jgi:hypothetical protein
MVRLTYALIGIKKTPTSPILYNACGVYTREALATQRALRDAGLGNSTPAA